MKLVAGTEDGRDDALRGGLTRRRAVGALLQVGALAHPFGWRVLALGSSSTQIEPQPLQAAVRRLVDAMAYLGEPLSDADRARLDAAGRLTSRFRGRRRDRARPRSTLPRGSSNQPGEPGVGRARRRAGATRRARLAGISDQGPQRGRRHRSAERRKPAGEACLPAGDRVAARAAISASRRRRRSLARAHDLRREADGAAAVRSGARVPHRAALQPRSRPPRGADRRQPRGWHRRHRIPQPHGRPLRHRRRRAT